MGLLYGRAGRAGRLNTKNTGFRPGQWSLLAALLLLLLPTGYWVGRLHGVCSELRRRHARLQASPGRVCAAFHLSVRNASYDRR